MTFDRYLTQNNVSFVLCDIGNNKIIKTVPEMLGKLRKLETLLLGAFILFVLDWPFFHAETEF